MIYLDSGATSFYKPPAVYRAVREAMVRCANPGRGGYGPAMEAARRVFACREQGAKLFHCRPDQVVLTHNCTHGLNIAVFSLVKPGSRVLISGFEHNSVTRPLHALGAKVVVAGRRLFDWEDTLSSFQEALKQGVDAAVITHVSNVFGYILPVQQLAALCREYAVPFVIDAAQSAGVLDVNMGELGADFIAMPGHKGLLGPQGTGILLCADRGTPRLFGGTGSESKNQAMPSDLPERLEAGTVNVPGIAGLAEGLRYLNRVGVESVFQREHRCLQHTIAGLSRMGFRVFAGEHQAGSVSFLPGMDCEEAAGMLGKQGIAVRAGLHCAPLAHESAGTLTTGTVRVSFGYQANLKQSINFLTGASKLLPGKS